MSSELSIELGISPEREKVINDRLRKLIKTQPTLAGCLIELDKLQDLSSIEKLATSATLAAWVLESARKHSSISDRKVPLTSKS